MSLVTKTYVARGERFARLAKLAQKRFRLEASQSANDVEAVELADAAARCFLIAEQPLLAAESYHKCAEASLRLKKRDDAAAFYALAGDALEDASPFDARDAFQRAIDLFCDAETWDLAGLYAVRVARLHDRLGNAEDRSGTYRAAADLLSAAVRRDHPRLASLRDECLETAAKHDALARKQYALAAHVFEDLALECCRANLTSLNATRQFFRSALCLLADRAFDVARAKISLFGSHDGHFQAAPERLFLLDVLDCVVTRQPTTDEDDDRPSSPRLEEKKKDKQARRERTDIFAGEESSSSEESSEDELIGTLERDVPDRDAFVDRAYDLAAVRDLDSFELALLKRIHQLILDKLAKHQRRLDRDQRRADKRRHELRQEHLRQLRIKRDALPS